MWWDYLPFIHYTSNFSCIIHLPTGSGACFNHTECRSTVLCHHYFPLKSRKPAHLCSALQMLKLEQIKKLPASKYHSHFNANEMFGTLFFFVMGLQNVTKMDSLASEAR